MKYPGPKDQYRRIERRYITRIGVGLIIIVITVLGNIGVNLGLTSTTVEVQRGVGEDPEEVLISFDRNNSIGILGIAAGSIVNFYSINRYRRDYSEIKGKEPRPSGLFVGVGIVLTFGAMALGWFGLIGF